MQNVVHLPETNSNLVFNAYEPGAYFDEMFSSSGNPRASYRGLNHFLNSLPQAEILKRANHADISFTTKGVTYTVYGDAHGIEKIIPFDMTPRLISAQEWNHLKKGLIQRVKALNAFLYDIYHDQKIIKEGLVPKSILSNPYYRKEMQGVNVPGNVYVHVSGIDLIRDENGVFRVLEDNLRCPSGVSYVLENREVMHRVMGELFQTHSVEPVSQYPQWFLSSLSSLCPEKTRPNVVLLTSGIFNSAYYEHAFLAAHMGIHLVEGRDLVVKNKKVYMKTTSGLERVHVIYRRIDDDYLDPLVFKPDSLLGVPGIFESYKAGQVVIANAVGNGIADDKAVYTYVPLMIQFYLGEIPILPNVETFLLSDKQNREFVLDRLEEMVVKTTDGSGGYGMLIGNQSDKKTRDEFTERILRRPGGYIAQKIIRLSRHPTFIRDKGKFEPRHIDLRPYLLMGSPENVRVLPGGLSRVALVEGSLVVNSSQGGGAKDTWVLSDNQEVAC